MESTPKKATEKIGGELRKKLPKKSVGLAGCQNGLSDRGSKCREPDCQIGSPTNWATARLAVRLTGRLTEWQMQAADGLPKLVTF